jgi:hypothetical protein
VFIFNLTTCLLPEVLDWFGFYILEGGALLLGIPFPAETKTER